MSDLIKPHTPSDRQIDDIRKWVEAIVRFNVVTNAGGALATLSFIGATWAKGGAFKVALWPMSFFVLGVVLAGFAINGEFVSAIYRAVGQRRISGIPEWFNTALKDGGLIGSIFGFAANMLFVLGATTGIALLAFS